MYKVDPNKSRENNSCSRTVGIDLAAVRGTVLLKLSLLATSKLVSRNQLVQIFVVTLYVAYEYVFVRKYRASRIA